MIEMSTLLAPERLAEFDAVLAREGLPSLHRLQDREKRNLSLILIRRRIRSDDEYDVVNRFLSDVDSNVLSEPERQIASQLILEYEDGK